MKYTLILFFRLVLKIFYIAPIDKEKILYMSYEGKKITCNPKYIYNYLIDKEKKLKHVWVLEEKKNFSSNERTESVKKGTLSFYYHFLTSKVIISNASIPTYIPLRKNQKYIETWHGGGAYKRTGLSYDQSDLQIKRLKLVAEEVTLFISSSEIFTETKSQNHLVDRDKFFEIGMPRNDVLFKGSQQLVNKVKEYYGLNKETKIVLYAPTYRNKDDDSTTYENLDINQLIDALKNKFDGEWVVFTRMHYYLNEELQYKDAINVSSYPDMQELMLAADALVTDYSSVMWDYSITKKPAFVFAPDMEEYEKNRSFFTPPENWPFVITKTNQELTGAIINFDQLKHEATIERHHRLQGSFEKGNATQKVYEKIISYTS